MGGRSKILTLLALASFACLNARAGLIYSNDFNGPVGATFVEWTSSSIRYSNSVSPPGSGEFQAPGVATTESPNQAQTFLGLFGGPPIGSPGDAGWNKTRVDQSVQLKLEHLPTHQTLLLKFDFYLIRSWDGDSPQFEPDKFFVVVDGGKALLDATFSNNPKTNSDGSGQSFPAPHSAPWSGARDIGTLGFDGFFKDSTYHFDLGVPHTNDVALITFVSSLFEGKGTRDECRGLDNVVVEAGTNGVEAP